MKRLFLLFGVLFTFTAQAGHGQNGEQLYQQLCSACHGERGDGGVGVPLNLPAFQASVDDRYLKQTIRLGRPGRVMPAFTTLTDAQVDAIVAHIRSWTDAPPPSFSQTPVQGDPQRGARAFAQHCASCHGPQARGGHGTGVTLSRKRDLPILAPALNNAGFLASASDEQILYTLRHGRQGTPMPAFAETLDGQTLKDITAWLRSLQAGIQPRQKAEQIEPVILVESEENYTDTIQSIKDTISGNNFRFIREQKLEQGFFADDEVDGRETILYFCNFNFLYDAMNVDPRVGMFLPCRITVVERKGKVWVMAANPKAMSILFNNDELDKACDTMEQIYRDLIEEATL